MLLTFPSADAYIKTINYTGSQCASLESKNLSDTNKYYAFIY
jgi:hypothetical protein